MIKRIVALEGDVVQTRAPYPETHIRVPKGHCWIEGDEMFHSTDSNHYGPVKCTLPCLFEFDPQCYFVPGMSLEKKRLTLLSCFLLILRIAKVPLGLIKAKVEYILYPFNRFGKIPDKPRGSRVHYAPGHRVYNRVDE